MAVELAFRGARLVLSARREDALKAVAAECGLGQDRVCIAAADLSQVGGIPDLVDRVRQQCPQIHGVVLNAGISQRSLVVETDLSVYRRIMELNFFSAVALTQGLLPHMLARGDGNLTVISSVVGKFGTPLRSGYSASKHALHGFFDSLRAEVWDRGLRVTLVCPGFIQTEISVSALDGSGEKYGKMDAAQMRGLPVDECARRIADAMARDREEVLMGGREVKGVYIKRFAPRWFSRMIRRVDVT